MFIYGRLEIALIQMKIRTLDKYHRFAVRLISKEYPFMINVEEMNSIIAFIEQKIR